MGDSSDVEPLNISDLVEAGKNNKTVFCTKCPSKILCKGVGVYVEVKGTHECQTCTEKYKKALQDKVERVDRAGSVYQYSLPNIGPKQSLADGAQEEEELKDYWQVDNMFNFENIGYSNTVDGRKFLVCADCESGPLGWQDLETKSSYLAVQRVKYCD